MFPHLQKFRSGDILSRSGFSLVEVIMALGVVSFSLLAIMGSLSVGLNLAQDSSTSLVVTKVMQQVRGDFSSLPFTRTADQPLSINDLTSQKYYYSMDGGRCESQGAYFGVSFEVGNPMIGGNVSSFNGGAKQVKVILEYPLDAPAANRQRVVSSVLVARQSGT